MKTISRHVLIRLVKTSEIQCYEEPEKKDTLCTGNEGEDESPFLIENEKNSGLEVQKDDVLNLAFST